MSVPEIFSYWLQGGRIDVGFLGAAQIDRFGNLNSTVIGDYERPQVRLPGGGGAPEIAALAQGDHRDHPAVAAALRRAARLPLVGGPPAGGDHRPGRAAPRPERGELRLAQIHPGVTVEQAREATGWDLRVADDLEETAAADAPRSCGVLRELRATLGAAA